VKGGNKLLKMLWLQEMLNWGEIMKLARLKGVLN